MDLETRIQKVEQNLKSAMERLLALDMSVGASLTGLSDDEKRAVISQLRKHSQARSDNIYAEIAVMGQAGNQHLNRASYNLRYRPQIGTGDAKTASETINFDLLGAANLAGLAATFSQSAYSYDPALDQQKLTTVQNGISHSLSETNRIIDGIIRSPLSDEEFNGFYKDYPTPPNPQAAFREETESLSESYVTIAELATGRIDQSREYGAYVLKSVMPVFADQSAGLQQQTVEMLQEAYNSEDRIKGLLNSAKYFAQQAKL